MSYLTPIGQIEEEIKNRKSWIRSRKISIIRTKKSIAGLGDNFWMSEQECGEMKYTMLENIKKYEDTINTYQEEIRNLKETKKHIS